MKRQLEQGKNFNATLFFNKFWNAKVLYQNESKINSVYSRNNLPKIKNGAYVISLDEFKLIATHWVALYVNKNNVFYFDSFGNEHIQKRI